MLNNYLKIALRSLWRSKFHSFINVLGLGLGISCCLLIALYVKDEWTFDTFHRKAGRIFRVYAREDWGENQQFFATVTPFPMGPALRDNFPEVEKQVRLNNLGSLVKVGPLQFSEQVTVAGQDFFDVFDFELSEGDRSLALSKLSGVVLTRRMAEKYFGPGNSVGKTVSIQLGENFEEFTVEAVTENPPVNSSIQFEILLSDLNYKRLYDQQLLTSGWFNINPETYVLLQEGINYKSVEAKFPSVFRTILGEENFNRSKYAPGLQPLTTIHLDTNFPVGMAPVGNPRYGYILAATALLILLVACINFVTLSTGRSLQRAKEVGIRKVVGALRKQIIIQFIGEAILITVIAMALGIGLSFAGLPAFNELAGKHLSLPLNVFLIIVLAALLIIIGIMAGSYPAFILSGFKPITILKGIFQSGSNKQLIRKALVGVQLILSIFLVSSTLVMRNQLNYLQNKNLGFNKEQLVVMQMNVPRTGRLPERMKAGFAKVQQFKNDLDGIPGIAGICGSSHDFGNGNWTSVGYTDDAGTYRNFSLNIIEPDYIRVMKMEIIAGRNFDINNASTLRRGVIVNETFAKEMGWPAPVGMKIPGKKFADHEIIGVVKDFNFSSLYTKVQPLVMVTDPVIILSGVENINIDNSPIPKLIVRLLPGNMATTIEKLKLVWNKITDEEFAFSFVDQTLDAQYRSDQNLGRIVGITTLLAILIGSLGLYALASLAMQNRTREISIRKIMGASEKSLLLLLSGDYLLLLTISLVLSVPLTWYAMNRWLQSFEYKVTISWQIFVLAGGFSLLLAMLTISYQAIRTAWSRPAETLKYE